jgi:hypothetical protein
MVERTNKDRRLSLMLLRESLWQIEDKVNIILESVADHEAELIRHKRSIDSIAEKLIRLESRRSINRLKGGKNDRQNKHRI